MFFSPWGKVITIHRANASLQPTNNGKALSPNVIAAIEQQSGLTFRDREEVSGYQYGYQIGAAGWAYLVAMLAAAGFALWWPDTEAMPSAAPSAIAAVVAVAAPGFLFLPRLQFAAWGACGAIVLALLLLAIALANLLMGYQYHSARS